MAPSLYNAAYGSAIKARHGLMIAAIVKVRDGKAYVSDKGLGE
jgi:hypothetical protein